MPPTSTPPRLTPDTPATSFFDVLGVSFNKPLPLPMVAGRMHSAFALARLKLDMMKGINPDP